MTTDTPANVDDYIAALPQDHATAVQELRDLVLSLVPGASETMAYNMPAVKVKGKTVLYYAGAANHLGIYPMPKVIELLRDELAAYSTSKGTIRIPYSEPLPVDLIKKIVAIRLSEVSH